MKTLLKLSLLALLLTLWAVPAASAQSEKHTYEITLTNLTDKQALSPGLVATHSEELHVWRMGEPASEGVRIIAEQGMPMTLASELQGKVTEVQTSSDPVMPGQSVTFRISANDGEVLSAQTMLVQTNDGFTGLDSVALTPGTIETMAYDAGTENNTELQSDVPGPPFMGMNRPATNPPVAIAEHEGIRGDADVDSSYGWEGAVARFEIRAVMDNMPAGMPNTGRGAADVTPFIAAGVVLAVTISGLWNARRRNGIA